MLPTPDPLDDDADGSLLDADMAAMAKKNPGRFWIALAIISAVVLMGLSAWRQGWFTPKTLVFVELPAAIGLQVGTPVKLKGFKIGEVSDIELEANLSVKAKLKISSERMSLLGEDASARFGRDGPLTGKFIDILPGAREGKRLAANAVLPMDVGNELEDVMGTVKVAVEKLAIAIAKIEPILDDTKKLTGEAAEIRKDVSKSVTTVLANMQDMSQQLKAMGTVAGNVATRMDKDSVTVLQDVRKITSQADAAASSAKNALATLEKDLPPALNQVKAALANAQEVTDNVKAVTQDVKTITGEAKQDVPATLRSVRSATQDAAEITDGAKKTWPISTFVGKPEDKAQSLPLEGFEGKKR